MGKLINISNFVFGRLTVIDKAGKDKFGHIIWKCKCECGNTTNVLVDNLLRGLIKSCSCLRTEELENRATHGFTKGSTKGIKVLSEHRSWSSMKGRCYNPKNKKYSRYGGRGITVCNRWIKSFENFIADMGMKPTPNLSIDRINNDGNYEPSNCRWATKKEQSNNRSTNRWLEYKGERKVISEWALFFKVSDSAINEKLKVSSMEDTFKFYYKKKLGGNL